MEDTMRVVIQGGEGTLVQTPGIQFGRDVVLHRETRSFIVLEVKGGGVYIDRGTGTRYQPAEFIVLEKVEKTDEGQHGLPGEWRCNRIITFPARRGSKLLG